MSVALQTGPDRMDFIVRGERFTSYHYGATPLPGFSALYAPEGRAVTRADNARGVSLWVAHSNVNGVAFSAEESAAASSEAGQIRTTEMVARRGARSVGFRQECAWIAPDGRCLLTDVRIARILPGPSEGRILDWTLHLRAPDDRHVLLDCSDDALLLVRAASSLCPSGGGQLRNSREHYGAEEVDGRAAAWCACVGVVKGETVGFALLDHPDNPWHPVPWLAREDGTLSPSPFSWRALEIVPGRPLTLRYRLLVHSGYVEHGWAHERLIEFARESSPF